MKHKFGTIYKITKIGKSTNPVHPNSDFGESAPFHLGVFTEPPVVGERFILLPIGFDNGQRGISTSPVTKIIDDHTFETLNSVYRYELYTNETQNHGKHTQGGL